MQRKFKNSRLNREDRIMKEIDLNKLAQWDKHYVPTLQLYGVEIEKLLSPCVYGWQRGNEWLYIGFSAHGLSRVINSSHHIFKTYTMWNTDIIYLWQPEGKTITEMKALEQTLILLLEPKFNRTFVTKKNPKRFGKLRPKIDAIAKRRRERTLREEASQLLQLVDEDKVIRSIKKE